MTPHHLPQSIQNQSRACLRHSVPSPHSLHLAKFPNGSIQPMGHKWAGLHRITLRYTTTTRAILHFGLQNIPDSLGSTLNMKSFTHHPRLPKTQHTKSKAPYCYKLSSHSPSNTDLHRTPPQPKKKSGNNTTTQLTKDNTRTMFTLHPRQHKP